MTKAIHNRSRNQETMELGDFDVWNNEIRILMYQNEAEQIYKAVKPFLNRIIMYFAQKSQ